MDITKAFDTVDWDVVQAAFEEFPVPWATRRSFMLACRAPKVCCVLGKISDWIQPTRGLPRGTPVPLRCS